MQNPPEGAHVALFLVNQTSSRALGNMTDGVPPFRLQPEKVQAARLRIHRLEEGPHRSKHGGSPPEKLPEPQGAVDCASRGPEACNWVQFPLVLEIKGYIIFSSVQSSHSVMSDSL